MSEWKKIILDFDGVEVRVDEDVYALRDEVIKHRRYFRIHPESSLKEFETAAYIRNILDEEGISYVTVGETGTLATICGDKQGPTIFLRGDIDALEMNDDIEKEYASIREGLCHACGHDAHAATLLGAALLLNRRKSELAGVVKLAFQQAEEIGAGARVFVAEGHLEDVDFAFGTHIASQIPLGQVAVTPGAQSASCDIFTITVHGEGAHVCAPHQARDAAIATAHIAVALQHIVSRERNPLDEVVVGIGKLQSGTRYNVIASEGVIEGTVRAFSNEVRAHVLERVETIARLTAEIHGCSISFSNYPAANPLINELEKTEWTQEIAAKIVPSSCIIKNAPKSLGAEDFADYLAVVPGTFVQVGSQSSDETAYPHHHTKFDIDERALLIETQLYVEVATDFLKDK